VLRDVSEAFHVQQHESQIAALRRFVALWRRCRQPSLHDTVFLAPLIELLGVSVATWPGELHASRPTDYMRRMPMLRACYVVACADRLARVGRRRFLARTARARAFL
jgi:hypothetical protein